MLETDTIIKQLKRQIIFSTLKSGEGHIASAFSTLDIIWILYDKVLSIDLNNPTNRNRDRFILSKGHGGLALYAVLAEKAYFPKSEMEDFACRDSRLGGHPDCKKVPGVEASTGSLGHGLPFALGMSLGMRIKGINNHVYCLVGDAECNEGSIWESFLLAAHHKLGNITCIVDHNHSTDRALTLGNLYDKLNAFGWETIVIDGHDNDSIFEALSKKNNENPYAIIAETIKGHGCKEMENNPAWHHRVPTTEELTKILNQIT